jgi:WG containing repeat
LANVEVVAKLADVGYIDHEGHLVISARLSYGASFHEGLAAAIVDGPCQIMNGGSCGQAEFRPMKVNPDYDCRYSFIDKAGKPISSERFDDAMDFSEGLAPVRIGDHWGFADKTGHIAISPRFESVQSFSEGLAAARVSGKVGFIDRTGYFVIPPRFQDADSFSDGRAVITEGIREPKFRFIDKTGKPAFPGEYAMAASFAHGLAPVAFRMGHRGVEDQAWIDTSGKVVCRFGAQR